MIHLELESTELELTELESNELKSKFHYAQIKELYVYKDHKIMLTNKIKVVSICPHIRSIKALVTEQELLCHFDNLYCHGVLHLSCCIHRNLVRYIVHVSYSM